MSKAVPGEPGEGDNKLSRAQILEARRSSARPCLLRARQGSEAISRSTKALRKQGRAAPPPGERKRHGQR